jgi:hypothetical protein
LKSWIHSFILILPLGAMVTSMGDVLGPMYVCSTTVWFDEITIAHMFPSKTLEYDALKKEPPPYRVSFSLFVHMSVSRGQPRHASRPSFKNDMARKIPQER